MNGIAEEMAEGIEEGKIGAFSTEDEKTSGYYLVEWKSEAYTLQEDTVLTEFDPPLELQAGELVVDATYLNLVPRAPLWYTPSKLNTTVRVKQVLAVSLNTLGISDGNKVPRGCNKREVERLEGKRLHDADHEEILDERMRRVALDHDEITSAEYYQSGDESGNDDNDEIVVMRGKEMITASEHWHLDLRMTRRKETTTTNNKIKSENRFFES